MKKIIIIIAIVSFFVNHSIAQENDPDLRDKLQLGLKVGANYSNVYDTQGDNFNADSKFGLAAGAFMAIPIGKYIGIQPELLFTQKGYRTTGSVLGSNYEFTHTTSFIDIPILFALKPSQFITLLAGPQYSFLTKIKNEFKNSILSAQQEQNFDNNNIRKNILCFTGGIDFSLNPLVIGAKVGWDLQHNNGDGTSTNPRYKNVWYQATLGIKF